MRQEHSGSEVSLNSFVALYKDTKLQTVHSIYKIYFYRQN